MTDPVGVLGLYIEGSQPRCQTVAPIGYTNRSWAELLLREIGAPLTVNNIDNILSWMAATNSAGSWWGTGSEKNNPLGLGLQNILTTIMHVETPPQALNPPGSSPYAALTYGTGGASGAYQFEQSTWRAQAEQAGFGTQYPYAAAAPPAVQDAVAAHDVAAILQQYGDSVPLVPVIWYTGNPQGYLTPTELQDNNGLTAAQYQARWMQYYNGLPATVPTPVGGYPDLAVAANAIAGLIAGDQRFAAIYNALMSDADAAAFSAAVVQSPWSPGHYGVLTAGAGASPTAGNVSSDVYGRALNYLATVPAPPEVTAPLSHGSNISGSNGVGWDFKSPQVWLPKLGPLPPEVDPNAPNATPVDIASLPPYSPPNPPGGEAAGEGGGSGGGSTGGSGGSGGAGGAGGGGGEGDGGGGDGGGGDDGGGDGS